jgi:hypothetical protein
MVMTWEVDACRADEVIATDREDLEERVKEITGDTISHGCI